MKSQSEWIYYGGTDVPSLYEWCLWSFLYGGERHYCTGRLSKSSDKLWLELDEGTKFILGEVYSVYWAKVELIND